MTKMKRVMVQIPTEEVAEIDEIRRNLKSTQQDAPMSRAEWIRLLIQEYLIRQRSQDLHDNPDLAVPWKKEEKK